MPRHVIDYHLFGDLTSRDHLPTVMEVRRRYFKEPYPATTAGVVAGLANPEWLIEIEATAVLP